MVRPCLTVEYTTEPVATGPPAASRCCSNSDCHRVYCHRIRLRQRRDPARRTAVHHEVPLETGARSTRKQGHGGLPWITRKHQRPVKTPEVPGSRVDREGSGRRTLRAATMLQPQRPLQERQWAGSEQSRAGRTQKCADTRHSAAGACHTFTGTSSRWIQAPAEPQQGAVPATGSRSPRAAQFQPPPRPESARQFAQMAISAGRSRQRNPAGRNSASQTFTAR